MSNGGPWQPPHTGAPPPPPQPLGGGPYGPPTSAPQVTVEPAPPGRSRGKVIAAAVGAVAIIGAGVFAVSRISGDGDAGGAATPEEAGLALLAALENEDLLGMADVLLPGEQRTLSDPAIELADELKRLEVLSDDASLDAVSGVDIVVEDESVEVLETNVDDIVNLDISASVSGSVDGEELPVGDWLTDTLDTDLSELDEEATDPDETTFGVTAVREDGRWYVSLFHTWAEVARREQPDAPDIPAEGVEPAGGETPEEAMDVVLDAVANLDLEALIASLNPDEFQALQRYAPLFLDDAQAEVESTDVQIEIGDREYMVSESDGTASVAIDALTVDVSAEGETVKFELRDGCFVVTVDGETTDSCEITGATPDLGDLFEDPQPVEDLIDSLQETFADYENPGLVVKEIDGQWFLSPVATVTEQVLAVVRALSREEIEDVSGQIEEVVEVLDDLVLSGGPAVPVFEDFELPTDDGVEVPTTEVADETLPPDPAEDCYGEQDATAAAACFDALVTAGEIDVSLVPWFLRFPECGLAESGWSGDYYSLPDAEFDSLVSEVAPCFQALIASGEVDEFDLPIELIHPECLGGRNLYTASETEYIEEFETCAFG